MPISKKQSEILQVGQIYKTVHGEWPNQGKVVTIVRLAGCDSACSYCDSKAFWKSKGKTATINDIINAANKLKTRNILLTGGEPLKQVKAFRLLKDFVRKGFNVTLETDGSYPLKGIPSKVIKVMDLKTPQSKAKRKTLISNIKELKGKDVLKVVIASKKDYAWAKKFLKRYSSAIKSQVVFSPVYDKLCAKELSKLMIRDNSDHRMQIQLHKYLGLK